MSPLVVALCYGSAIVISLFLLWYFGSQNWLLHVAAVILAFFIGLTPLSEPWNLPVYTLAVGWVFLLFVTWGVCGLILRLLHYDSFFRPQSWHHH